MDFLHEFISDHVKNHKIEKYFEVGTQEGNSLKAVVTNCDVKKVVCCDNWGKESGGTGRGSHDHIVKLLSEWTYNGVADFFDGNSHKTIKLINQRPENKEQYDLVLVDGDHSIYGATMDLMDCWPLVKPGGYLFFDDIIHEGHCHLERVFDNWVQLEHNLFYSAKHYVHTGLGVAQKAFK